MLILYLLDEASCLVVEESMLLGAQCSRRSLESADVVVGRHGHLRIWCACAIDIDLWCTVGERRWSAHFGCALVVFCESHLVSVYVIDREKASVGVGFGVEAGY